MRTLIPLVANQSPTSSTHGALANHEHQLRLAHRRAMEAERQRNRRRNLKAITLDAVTDAVIALESASRNCVGMDTAPLAQRDLLIQQAICVAVPANKRGTRFERDMFELLAGQVSQKRSKLAPVIADDRQSPIPATPTTPTKYWERFKTVSPDRITGRPSRYRIYSNAMMLKGIGLMARSSSQTYRLIGGTLQATVHIPVQTWARVNACNEVRYRHERTVDPARLITGHAAPKHSPSDHGRIQTVPLTFEDALKLTGYTEDRTNKRWDASVTLYHLHTEDTATPTDSYTQVDGNKVRSKSSGTAALTDLWDKRYYTLETGETVAIREHTRLGTFHVVPDPAPIAINESVDIDPANGDGNNDATAQFRAELVAANQTLGDASACRAIAHEATMAFVRDALFAQRASDSLDVARATVKRDAGTMVGYESRVSASVSYCIPRDAYKSNGWYSVVPATTPYTRPQMAIW